MSFQNLRIFLLRLKDFFQSPPKIKSIRIVDNPFDDIVPRITAAERREQQRAREQGHREKEEEQRRKGAKKCAFFL